MATIEYLQFDAYMTSSGSRYQPTLFSQDIMYFCKLWKSHRQQFAGYCKRKGLVASYLTLNQRCVDYETNLLDYQKQSGKIDNETFRQQLKIVQKVFL